MKIVLSNLPSGEASNYQHVKNIIDSFCRLDVPVVIGINKEFLTTTTIYHKAISRSNVIVAIDSVLLNPLKIDMDISEVNQAITDLGKHLNKEINILVESEPLDEKYLQLLKKMSIHKIYAKNNFENNGTEVIKYDYTGNLLDFIKQMNKEKSVVLNFDVSEEVLMRKNIGLSDYERLIDRLKLYILLNS